MLAVEDISVGYRDGELVLHGVGFSLRRGEILAILGPNGAGKTTLLRCVNAMAKPWRGKVHVEGADIFRMPPLEIAKRLGYVAQRSEAGRMTAFDAVLLGRIPHLGWRARESDLAKVGAALSQLGIERLALRFINELSGGELQKVCIARALAQEPRLLLLDEPTSSLDLKNQVGILDAIRGIVTERRMAAVMTMHDLNLALRFADRYIFLKQGKVLAWGRPDRIDPQTVEEAYGIGVDILRHNGHVVVVPKESRNAPVPPLVPAP